MSTKQRQLKVFLSYASQDEVSVREVYNALKLQTWIDPWLDKEKLLAGQDWEFEIRKTVRESDVVVVCLSKQFNRSGFRQKEVRLALDTAMEKPDGEIFIIPARLEDCDTPESLRKWHRVDLFEENGYENLIRALRADQIEADLELEGNLPLRAATLPKSSEHTAEKAQSPSSEGLVLQESSGNQPTVSVPPSTNNTVRVDDQGHRQGKSKRMFKLDPAIIAAIITVIGTILVSLIPLYTNRPAALPPATPSTAVAFTSTSTNALLPTATITSEPTSTPIPATDSPVPTITIIPPVALGEDWLAGCISTLWRPYPEAIPVSEKGDGCWKEPVYVFSAENGDLDFLAERSNAPAEIYGLFAPLPEEGTVTFTVRLRDLTNVDLWMGIFAEPDVRSEGLLMIVPSGDVRRRVFVQKDPRNYENIADTRLLPLENGFSISFSFTENSARSTVNPSVFFTNSVSIPSSQKWLFLGYKGLRGSYRIDGTFLSFELE